MPMTPFLPGQRWLSETQTELGLGLVTAVEGRRVSILFPATGETRIYGNALVRKGVVPSTGEWA